MVWIIVCFQSKDSSTWQLECIFKETPDIYHWYTWPIQHQSQHFILLLLNNCYYPTQNKSTNDRIVCFKNLVFHQRGYTRLFTFFKIMVSSRNPFKRFWKSILHSILFLFPSLPQLKYIRRVDFICLYLLVTSKAVRDTIFFVVYVRSGKSHYLKWCDASTVNLIS